MYRVTVEQRSAVILPCSVSVGSCRYNEYGGCRAGVVGYSSPDGWALMLYDRVGDALDSGDVYALAAVGVLDASRPGVEEAWADEVFLPAPAALAAGLPRPVGYQPFGLILGAGAGSGVAVLPAVPPSGEAKLYGYACDGGDAPTRYEYDGAVPLWDGAVVAKTLEERMLCGPRRGDAVAYLDDGSTVDVPAGSCIEAPKDGEVVLLYSDALGLAFRPIGGWSKDMWFEAVAPGYGFDDYVCDYSECSVGGCGGDEWKRAP